MNNSVAIFFMSIPTNVPNDIYIYIYIYIYKTSGSESWPRKVKLTCAHSKEHDYRESLHITTKPVITPVESSLTALIFIT